jgi:RNA polymerase sigma factor (sigma-70 family)
MDRERSRLRNFIRKRVPDAAEVEDVLQDVFYELLEAYRLMQPVEKVSAWLFRVARNRIIDLFRKRRPEVSSSQSLEANDEDEPIRLEELLPSPEAGPEAAYAREILLEELDAALEELPVEQREVFIAHEMEGRSFNELAQATGLSANTLRLRKHYAVLQLRERLRAIYDEFTNNGGPKK